MKIGRGVATRCIQDGQANIVDAEVQCIGRLDKLKRIINKGERI